ncbi:hypothetical protein M427DRAFT_355208 [Gonapodya prolifera JEL478]|uniref:F-box domain-containing protein n=1 Tax=Gonapodya prolifera (strain JEL478) TaxID=1344416 RepID=A0A139ABF1_GONPJ|nr:hypothetical protein M427DRAFT_355208 [Gonapodya prolifera JEL478]|eukprot:KXS14152.1 hypothetical protein M427DRAFT_355208 [Gonapodya prolifera JEL478]
MWCRKYSIDIKMQLSGIPLETLKAITWLLPVRAIVRPSSTSRALHAIVAIPSIWERLDFSDITPGLTDQEYTSCLSQISRWIAPSPRCDARMAQPYVANGMVEIIFDGTRVTSWTAIAAMHLPRIRRLSFRGCELDFQPLTTLMESYTITLPRRPDHSEEHSALEIIEFDPDTVRSSTPFFAQFLLLLRRIYPNLKFRPGICDRCWKRISAAYDAHDHQKMEY